MAHHERAVKVLHVLIHLDLGIGKAHVIHTGMAFLPVPCSGFHFDSELDSRGPNAAKNHLNHTPFGFGFRPLQLVVRDGVYHTASR
jgi:hypothetical protein